MKDEDEIMVALEHTKEEVLHWFHSMASRMRGNLGITMLRDPMAVRLHGGYAMEKLIYFV